MRTETTLARYERWLYAHEKKKIKQEEAVVPKVVEEKTQNNVIYVDFKARKRIK